MLTFNVILGHQGVLFRDFCDFFLGIFFQSHRPTQYQETHSTLNEKKKGDGLSSICTLVNYVIYSSWICIWHFQVLSWALVWPIHLLLFAGKLSLGTSTTPHRYNSMVSIWKIVGKSPAIIMSNPSLNRSEVVIATIYNRRSDPNHQIEIGVIEPQGTDLCQTQFKFLLLASE